jgi:hypothetical protein
MFVCEKAVITLENRGSYTEDFNLVVNRRGKISKLLPGKEQPKNTKEDPRVKYVRKIAERFIKSCAVGKPATPNFKDGIGVSELIEKIRMGQI